MKYWNKSQAAFLMSCEKLFEKKKTIYFWTFTFQRVMPDWYYPRSWNLFVNSLNHYYGGFIQGLRVLEVHPGGHGLHYHALFDTRVSVHLVRRLTNRYGMGRCQAEVCTKEGALYLAKYLTKENPLWPGMRRWGTIGGFKAVKKNRIEVDSAFHRNMKELAHGKQRHISFVTEVMRRSILFGDLREWPDGQKETLDKIAESDKLFGNGSTNTNGHIEQETHEAAPGGRRVYQLNPGKVYPGYAA